MVRHVQATASESRVGEDDLGRTGSTRVGEISRTHAPIRTRLGFMKDPNVGEYTPLVPRSKRKLRRVQFMEHRSFKQGIGVR